MTVVPSPSASAPIIVGAPRAETGAPGIDAYRVDWKVWAAWFVGFAVFSAILPRDAHFDIAHYHIHNGWALANDRLGVDMAPAGLHSFLNPVHSLIVWWLISALPGPLVVAVLSVVQAALLPVLYVLGARLSARLDLSLSPLLLAVAALAGFLTLSNVLMQASLLNDHWGALTFLIALVLLVGRHPEPPSLVSFGLASFLVGAMAGLKLTNAIYIPGFAAAALVLTESWSARWRASLISAVAGLAGIFLFGGWWAWMMWDMFGNPVYPHLNATFGSPPLGPDEAFRDPRYLPEGVIDALFRPFFFSFDGSLIYEYDVADFRFLPAYVATIGTLIWIGSRALRRLELPEGTRLVAGLSASFLVTYLFWAMMFSIIRYAMALWLVAPILVLVISVWAFPALRELKQFRLIALSICAAFVLTTSQAPGRRVAWSNWTEPYVSTKLPTDLDISGSVVVFSANYPTAFTAPAFSGAAWLTHADTRAWSRPALENYRPLIRERIESSTSPVYAVMFSGQGSGADELKRMASELGLGARFEACQALSTGFDLGSTHWVVCPLTRTD